MRGTVFFSAVAVLLLASAAQAQVVVYSAPVTTFYAPSYAVVPMRTVVRPHRIVTSYYAPAAIAFPATTAYYAPPVSTLRTTTYYSSVSSMPVATVTYREPVPVALPVVAYSPVVVGWPVVVGRGIVGQPKLYIPGQPVRNSVRFVSP